MASLYRNLAFVSFGAFNFSNKAFKQHQQQYFNPRALDVDCKGSVMIVTGANSGLGYETALQFAQRGATVYMLCRSKERGDQARQQIVDQTKNSQVFLGIVDVSRPDSIRDWIRDEFSKSGKQVDVLVNNAGILPQQAKFTPADNLEETFATNTLGSYLMTKWLLPYMKKSPAARVIFVSSGGMYTATLDPTDLQTLKGKFDGTRAYSHTKRQQVHMAEYFARQHPNVQFHSMHPGWAETPGVKSSIPGFYDSFKSSFRTQEEGADTIVWLSISEELLSKHPNESNGSFWFDRAPARKHLPLAFTQPSDADIESMIKQLDEIAGKYEK